VPAASMGNAFRLQLRKEIEEASIREGVHLCKEYALYALLYRYVVYNLVTIAQKRLCRNGHTHLPLLQCSNR